MEDSRQGGRVLGLAIRRWGFALHAALLAVLVLALMAVAGCGEVAAITSEVPRSDLVLASTTSTQDAGLFEVLIPAFEAEYPYRVKVIAVGSGEALALGSTGDADVLLVHSPAAEDAFMQKGLGLERRPVMYNDFIVVGPETDPAKIKGMNSAAAAFARIAGAEALFFSRGDHSGTYDKELSLWGAAGIAPQGNWYRSTGQGMGETLTIADQAGGYTLSDRATYLGKRNALPNLQILVEGDDVLFNQYHIIVVKNARNLPGARDFANWIVSARVQNELIGAFGVERFGQPLFVPNAGEEN